VTHKGPVQLTCTILLDLTDMVEMLFDVTRLAGFWAICTIASLSFMRREGIVGWVGCVDSCHCLLSWHVIL
jgi:hypothetical protein